MDKIEYSVCMTDKSGKKYWVADDRYGPMSSGLLAWSSGKPSFFMSLKEAKKIYKNPNIGYEGAPFFAHMKEIEIVQFTTTSAVIESKTTIGPTKKDHITSGLAKLSKEEIAALGLDNLTNGE